MHTLNDFPASTKSLLILSLDLELLINFTNVDIIDPTT